MTILNRKVNHQSDWGRSAYRSNLVMMILKF
jgi:hypothetical protein